MKIGITFYGITSGLRPSHVGGPIGSERDIRHCWPDHKKMLIDPFVEQGHEVSVYLSTYHPENPEIEDYIYQVVSPKRMILADKTKSDPFTTKGLCLKPLLGEDLDFVIICRVDMHLHKIMANENVEYDKFNFLFKEEGWWDSHRFTTDNFYMFPYRMIEQVDRAIQETYCYPRGYPLVDTHGLLDKLIQYIPREDIHIMSEVHELSDINMYYTLCRTGMPTDAPRSKMMHPAVRERYGYQIGE